MESGFTLVTRLPHFSLFFLSQFHLFSFFLFKAHREKKILLRVFFFFVCLFPFWRGLVNQQTVRNLVRSCEILFFRKPERRKEKKSRRSCYTCVCKQKRRNHLISTSTPLVVFFLSLLVSWKGGGVRKGENTSKQHFFSLFVRLVSFLFVVLSLASVIFPTVLLFFCLSTCPVEPHIPLRARAQWPSHEESRVRTNILREKCSIIDWIPPFLFQRWLTDFLF